MRMIGYVGLGLMCLSIGDLQILRDSVFVYPLILGAILIILDLIFPKPKAIINQAEIDMSFIRAQFAAIDEDISMLKDLDQRLRAIEKNTKKQSDDIGNLKLANVFRN